MKTKNCLFYAIGLLLYSTFAQIAQAQNGYYFLTNQGLVIWKEPYKGWKEIGEASVNDSLPGKLVMADGIGTVAFNGDAGNSFLQTNFEHGDCKLYTEVLLPTKGKASILLQGRYEIILADSGAVTETGNSIVIGTIAPRKRADSLVDERIPKRNAFSGTGKWQTVEVFFKAPRFGDRGVKTDYAKVWVKVNGITVQNGVELVNVTANGQSKSERLTGPLVLAGKQADVAFRNMSLKRLNMKRDYYPY